jgi:hypothetical protein
MSLLTRRIPTIVGLLLFVALVLGGIYYFQLKNPKTASGIIPDKVRITNIADNKFSVSWVSNEATTGSVEYGQVGEKLTKVAYDERDSATNKGSYVTHHVTIEGLQPSTQYAFRILAGTKPTRFDNNGSPYTTSTGTVIGATPASQNFYGNIQLPSKQPADGAIVYITLPGGATASTLVRESGNYAFTLSTMRSSDLRSYVKYDPMATIASVTVESGKQQSVASVSLANSAPVPTITMGQNAEYLNVPETPAVAEVAPGSSASPAASMSPTSTESAQAPSIFNVEPLEGAQINAVSQTEVTILNPKEEGEVLTTLRPEFRGAGPAGTALSIALTGQKAVSDTTKIASDKTWTWAPVIDLKAGKQKIAVSYLDKDKKQQKIERLFTISLTKTDVQPAFEASPSGSTKPSVKPSPTARSASIASGSAVPVTGVIEDTLLTAGLGVVIMVIGAMLFAL